MVSIYCMKKPVIGVLEEVFLAEASGVTYNETHVRKPEWTKEVRGVNRNYQKELDAVLKELQKREEVPKLLLHSCCAPCSSYVLEYLSEFFEITVFYYNPNIYPEEEYGKRVEEQRRFLTECTFRHPVELVAGEYRPQDFYDTVRGLEACKEGTERCFACYRLRLREAAKEAVRLNCDYFTTTLSISPHKNAGKLNEIGEELASIYSVQHLPSDFKKKMVISVLWSCPLPMECIGRITAAAFFPCGNAWSRRRRTKVK